MCFLGVWWVLWGFFDLFFMKSFLFGADAAALLGTKLNLLLLSPSSSSSSSPLSLPLFMQVHLESNKTMHLGALPLPAACSVVCLHETLLLKWSGQLDHFSFLFSFLFLSPLSLPVPHTRPNQPHQSTNPQDNWTVAPRIKTEQLLLVPKRGSGSQIKTESRTNYLIMIYFVVGSRYIQVSFGAAWQCVTHFCLTTMHHPSQWLGDGLAMFVLLFSLSNTR